MRVLFLFFPWLVLAEGEGIPGREIFFQVLNFTCFFVLLIFFLKNPVQHFFKQRKKEFLSFKEQAEKQEQAQRNRLTILENKIKDLQSREKTIEKEAQQYGKTFQAEKEKEIQDWQRRKEQEQEFFVGLEKEKIKQKLFAQGKAEIVAQVEKVLKQESAQKDFHKKINQQFIHQMGTKS